MFIYLIVNHVTGKYYVGQHKGNNLRKYLQQKFYEAERNMGGRSYLYASIRKHGREAFTIHALLSDVQIREELDQKEKDFIAFLKSQDSEYGYNICRGGEGFTGPHAPEAKAKVTKALKQRWAQPGFKEHWNELMTGHDVSPATIDKIKAARAEQDESHRLSEWSKNKGAAEGKQGVAPEGTAWCCKCQYKPISEFSKDTRRPNGLAPYCKSCNHSRKGYFSTRSTPRKFSPEVKLAAVARLREGIIPAAEVAKSIGISSRLLRKWGQIFDADVEAID